MAKPGIRKSQAYTQPRTVKDPEIHWVNQTWNPVEPIKKRLGYIHLHPLGQPSDCGMFSQLGVVAHLPHLEPVKIHGSHCSRAQFVTKKTLVHPWVYPTTVPKIVIDRKSLTHGWRNEQSHYNLIRQSPNQPSMMIFQCWRMDMAPYHHCPSPPRLQVGDGAGTPPGRRSRWQMISSRFYSYYGTFKIPR